MPLTVWLSDLHVVVWRETVAKRKDWEKQKFHLWPGVYFTPHTTWLAKIEYTSNPTHQTDPPLKKKVCYFWELGIKPDNNNSWFFPSRGWRYDKFKHWKKKIYIYIYIYRVPYLKYRRWLYVFFNPDPNSLLLHRTSGCQQKVARNTKWAFLVERVDQLTGF